MNTMIENQEQEMPDASQIPHSADFADLVNKLLSKDPEQRIGTNGGATEILDHPWFTDVASQDFIDVQNIVDRSEPTVVSDDFFVRSNMDYFNA